MRGELFFGIKLKYLQTEYEPLRKIYAFKPVYDPGDQKWLWLFSYEKLKEVEAIVGTVDLPGRTYPKEQVNVPKWKGDDDIEVVEFPKIYQIITHQKREDGTVKELRDNVDKETVKVVWEKVIKKQPLNKPVRSATVCENICNAFEITRFNRESGSFQMDKFYGARRQSYTPYFYNPVKVLVHLGMVKHHKSGKIERLKDEWVEQAKLYK